MKENFNLSEKRKRKALKRRKIIKARLRAFGSKSLPIKRIEKKVEKPKKPKSWWQRILDFIKRVCYNKGR